MRGWQPDELRRAVTRLRADWTLPPDTEFVLLEGGYSHSNFRFTKDAEQYVVRIPGAGNIDTEHERRTLQDLPALTTAPLIAYHADTGHMLTQWVEGPLLVDAHTASGVDAHTASDVDAHMASRVDNRVDVPQIAAWYTALRSQLPPMAKPYRLEDRVRGYLAGSPSHTPMLQTATTLIGCTPLGAELAPSHNDLNPWNVIVADHAPERWVTLDWESAGLNNPLFDLVTIHSGLELEIPLTQFATLCGIQAAPVALHNVEVWFWLREYAWSVDQLRQGNERTEISAQLNDSAAKLEAFSARN